MQSEKRNPFKLKDFRGVNPNHISRLEMIGIKHFGQMLAAGKTAKDRLDLAIQADIPIELVLELVKLSDLARLPGVKGIRAWLYNAVGVDTVEKLAAYEPEDLLRLTSEFVRRTNFEGLPPLPKEVSSTIANARMLPKVVEW